MNSNSPNLLALLLLGPLTVLASEPAAALSETHFGEERQMLRRIYEACQTRAATTGKFPSGLHEISNLFAPSFQNAIPAGIEFKDPDTGHYRAIRKSPLGERAPLLRLRLRDGRWLNVSGTGWIYESGLYWETEFVDLLPRPYSDSRVIVHDSRPIPQRARQRSALCTAAQLDLTVRCNAIPTTPWFFGPIEERTLPSFGPWLHDGVLDLDGIRFDVRGVIQIEGRLSPKGGENVRYEHSYPHRVLGVPVGRKAETLHILAGTVTRAQKGDSVAMLRLHFGKDSEEVALRYGEQLAAPGDTASQSRQLYPRDGQKELLYSLHHLVIPSPRPGEVITSFDFVSGMSLSHPYLMAVTVLP
jgi:hypothetical protein